MKRVGPQQPSIPVVIVPATVNRGFILPTENDSAAGFQTTARISHAEDRSDVQNSGCPSERLLLELIEEGGASTFEPTVVLVNVSGPGYGFQ